MIPRFLPDGYETWIELECGMSISIAAEKGKVRVNFWSTPETCVRTVIQSRNTTSQAPRP